MTPSPSPRTTHRQFENMRWTGGYVLLVLASLAASRTAGASSGDADGNQTGNANVTYGGFVPVVFTKVNQIIAREGTCAVIDCNITGEPFPTVRWFNSHGERLDTENNGETSRDFAVLSVGGASGFRSQMKTSFRFMSHDEEGF